MSRRSIVEDEISGDHLHFSRRGQLKKLSTYLQIGYVQGLFYCHKTDGELLPNTFGFEQLS